MVAGFHVPAMPFVEVDGNAGAVACRQKGPSWVKVGTTSAGVVIVTDVPVDVHPLFLTVTEYDPAARPEKIPVVLVYVAPSIE